MNIPLPVLLLGDCVASMRELPDASVDAVVTDPPYGISFMGKHWDRFDIDERVGKRDVSKLGVRLTGNADPDTNRKETARTASAFANAAGEAGAYDFSLKGNRAFQQWTEEWASEAFRVLKPGGHLICFAATRTYHRMACGVEDAGFEVRDQIAWLFGSGFPKSLDVAKAIDKKLGTTGNYAGVKPGHAEFIDRTDAHAAGGRADGWNRPWQDDDEARERHHLAYQAGSEEAAARQGWGTALKPAFEPIVLARKPLGGTVAANVLEHGTGALNIDGCRIGFRDEADEAESKTKNRHADFGTEPGGNAVYGDYSMVESKNYDPPGRWPANVILDEDAAAALDAQTGESKSTGGQASLGDVREARDPGFGDVGGASRFFYCAKVSRAERNAGLDGFDEQPSLKLDPTSSMARDGRRGSGVARNVHPTVKPIDLMRWLLRLVTPPGGVVLDPFLGSGSTGCAAALEGFGFIGCEREPDYLAIAEARIAFWAEHGDDGLRIVRERDAATAKRAKVSEAGQLDLLSGEAAA